MGHDDSGDTPQTLRSYSGETAQKGSGIRIRIPRRIGHQRQQKVAPEPKPEVAPEPKAEPKAMPRKYQYSKLALRIRSLRLLKAVPKVRAKKSPKPAQPSQPASPIMLDDPYAQTELCVESELASALQRAAQELAAHEAEGKSGGSPDHEQHGAERCDQDPDGARIDSADETFVPLQGHTLALVLFNGNRVMHEVSMDINNDRVMGDAALAATTLAALDDLLEKRSLDAQEQRRTRSMTQS